MYVWRLCWRSSWHVWEKHKVFFIIIYACFNVLSSIFYIHFFMLVASTSFSSSIAVSSLQNSTYTWITSNGSSTQTSPIRFNLPFYSNAFAFLPSEMRKLNSNNTHTHTRKARKRKTFLCLSNRKIFINKILCILYFHHRVPFSS